MTTNKSRFLDSSPLFVKTNSHQLETKYKQVLSCYSAGHYPFQF